MSSFSPSRRGVTLLEVLIVIGILAILIGLVLTAVQKVRASAIHVQSVNNERQMILAFHQLLDVESNKVKGLPSTKDVIPPLSYDQTIFMQLLP